MSDPALAKALAGLVIRSETSPGVQYRLVSPLGEGGMGIAFYAVREGSEGVTPAVLKVVKPDIVGLLPKLLWHMDEPLSDTAFITTVLVSEFAREDVKARLPGR